MANDDLSNNHSPYASGKMTQDDPTADINQGYQNNPAGYYSRGVSGSFTPGPNPFSAGVGVYGAGEDAAGQSMRDTAQNLTDDLLTTRQAASDSAPTVSDYNADVGWGNTGNGRS